MRLRILAVVAVAALLCVAVIHQAGLTALPDPTAILLRMRNPPLRFTLSTDPEPPSYGTPITLKVHVIDAASHPADGLSIEADVSMDGTDRGAQHVTLRGEGNGNYRGVVDLEMAGSWDVDLTATKGGERGCEKLSIEVGSPPSPSTDDDDTETGVRNPE
jgi:hypothetical protein